MTAAAARLFSALFRQFMCSCCSCMFGVWVSPQLHNNIRNGLRLCPFHGEGWCALGQRGNNMAYLTRCTASATKCGRVVGLQYALCISHLVTERTFVSRVCQGPHQLMMFLLAAAVWLD